MWDEWMKTAQLCPTLYDPIDHIVHGILQDTGVGSLSLLQGIFPTHGSNPGLPHCRQILYQLSHKRSPRILAWVAYPFSSKSSQPRKWMDWYLVSNSHTINDRCLFWLFSSLDLLAVNMTGWGSRWLLYTKHI